MCIRDSFYAEKGGQIGDAGVLAKDDAIVAVLDTKEPEKGLIAHTVNCLLYTSRCV